MQIPTSRFGTVSATETDIITFPEGLVGFSNMTQFVLLDDPNDEIFAWLQSCQDPKLAFPILEPELFLKDYKVSLGKHELESLKAAEAKGLRYLTIVTIPEDITQMTANLKAPIVVNVKQRLARQVVAQENDYPIKFPVFGELQKRFVQSTMAKTQTKKSLVDVEFAVKLADVKKSPGPETTLN